MCLFIIIIFLKRLSAKHCMKMEISISLIKDANLDLMVFLHCNHVAVGHGKVEACSD